MDNYTIADQFSLLSKLMDIHGENSFKTKTYSNAAFQIERLTTALETMSPTEISSVKGIGDATAKKIIVLIDTGKLPVLDQYISNTPAGILEMMNIKGIGPKKINVIWKEMEIETVGELLYACNENRLTLYKGFGEKTQQNVKDSLEFYLSKQGVYLYRDAKPFVEFIFNLLQNAFTINQFHVTGDYRRQAETIEEIDFVTDAGAGAIKTFFIEQPAIQFVSEEFNKLKYRIESGPIFNLVVCTKDDIGSKLFQTTGSGTFLDDFEKRFFPGGLPQTNNEINIFEMAGITLIEPYLREDATVIEFAFSNNLPTVISKTDIRAIIHSHSTWSDGVNTLQQMAEAAIENNFEYLVISDHSRSAGYANGLSIERIHQQHLEIDSINHQLAPFKIFKSIESDILNDGSLDYPDEMLGQFDLVIASIHSNLKMTQEKAMERLLKAIENPFTTILGHMTGRLLLSRAGYPVDHKKIIDACAANRVAIEVNANPRRLDMDWRWLPYALKKNVLISINPDAHFIGKFSDVEFGVLVAQKGMVIPNQNLSSFTLQMFEQYIIERKQWRFSH